MATSLPAGRPDLSPDPFPPPPADTTTAAPPTPVAVAEEPPKWRFAPTHASPWPPSLHSDTELELLPRGPSPPRPPPIIADLCLAGVIGPPLAFSARGDPEIHRGRLWSLSKHSAFDA